MFKFIDRIRDFIKNIDPKQFYKYLIISLAVLIVLMGLMIFRYYRNVNYWMQRINTINEERESAQQILARAKRVKKQRADVDALIAKDEGFKIGGYFDSVLAKLRLKDKNPINDTTTIDHEGKYRESILKAKLTDLNMKELSELLNELDQNERIYTKDLEIVAVKKDRPTLDVTLTIAALEPKATPQG